MHVSDTAMNFLWIQIRRYSFILRFALAYATNTKQTSSDCDRRSYGCMFCTNEQWANRWQCKQKREWILVICIRATGKWLTLIAPHCLHFAHYTPQVRRRSNKRSCRYIVSWDWNRRCLSVCLCIIYGRNMYLPSFTIWSIVFHAYVSYPNAGRYIYPMHSLITISKRKWNDRHNIYLVISHHKPPWSSQRFVHRTKTLTKQTATTAFVRGFFFVPFDF